MPAHYIVDNRKRKLVDQINCILDSSEAAGEAGIVRMLELLETEIRTTLGLMGITSLAQLNPSWVRPAQPVAAASATSAYPWFEERERDW